MTHQVATQSSRPEEPQCYNCGGMGHWAVACPEPTRETPAGLAAWRTASATRPGSGRAQQSDGRKSKGPIITKYGPPPPPAGYDEHATSAFSNSSKLSERNVRSINGHKDRDNDDRSSTARNRTKSESSVQDDVEGDGRPPKRFRRSSRDRSRSTSRNRDIDDLPPLDRRRSRSLQRRSSPSRSPRSRTSSVSSRSSDLNSLEAELLGVSARRPSTDSEARRRPERIAPPKAKRRKPTNSAFSRRW
ncbi:hypothetical protein LMH87_012301 [Akanthomyces muscarius]|uniref:CCHC-type domain-containing protein n=1 Tax=Akanthomyces muscarius TaxID=2231603 RepID=A0A9W8ULW7_AKAMU|nr:hypothetical protein LMH87_012301 [Akanthomyces muscarius]KAJ4151611.1 hypothetical protein LMH87_012301 [Akanthomyces muscarius]